MHMDQYGLRIYDMNEYINDEFYLTDDAPSGGRERQIYFIEKMKLLLNEKREAEGKRPTYAVETFGCQMNFHDSEKLCGILTEIGFEEAPSEEADIVIFNTCTIRENANQKLYGHLGRLKKKRLDDPDMIIGICGCMMQEPDEIENIRNKYKYVDLVFGTFNFHRLAELLWRHIDTGEQIIEVEREFKEQVEDLPSLRKYGFKSGLNIMYGCNNFCTYCIVPYVRGRERSRAPESVLREARALSHDGVTEIMLLGQNVNSYGTNFIEDSEIIMSDPTYGFPKLLRDVAEIKGIERVRFMTSHPKDMSDELLYVIKSNEKISRHIHLPLQSGSDKILKRMNRHYTREGYLRLVDKIYTLIPDASLTTDIIVGFPGETEEDFLDTLSVVESSGYDQAFTFIYSPRTGTPAASYEDAVSEDVIKDRFARLLEVVNSKAEERTGRFKGMILDVIPEEKDEAMEGFITGKTNYNTTVHFRGDESLIGKVVKVRMDQCRGFYYTGTLI